MADSGVQRRRFSRRSCVARAGVLSILVFSSCSLPLPHWWRSIEVELSLPDQPKWWSNLGAISYLIVMENPPGNQSTLSLESGAAQAHVHITKGGPVPVLAYPLVGGRSDLLRPAGGIFPFSLDDRGALVLSFEDGFLSELLMPVTRAGDLAGALNIARLQSEIWERSEGDPWVLDRDAILGTLVYGAMSSNRIKNLAAFRLEIEATPGLWYSGDPFRGPVVVTPELKIFDAGELPVGVHHFFLHGDDGPELELSAAKGASVAPRGEIPVLTTRAVSSSHMAAITRLDLMIDEVGWLSVNSVTGDVASGRW
ncbi:MAG TPA: hypothetical protein VMW69_03350 [Spirochaetia bacterium]|nr:hypothetical protein [Spirochaetia bacterium]